MTPTSWAILGLTLIVAMLVGVLLFAVLRLGSALRGKRRGERAAGGDSMLLTSAMEDAITRLKAQERATAARADASERLSGEIVASLTSGLVVVDSNGRVQTVNPAARRILHLADSGRVPDSAILDAVPALGAVIQESLCTSHPVLRRTLALELSGESMRLGVSVSPIAAERVSSGAICLFSDLTDVFALEEQLRLKEALARLGELTAGLAHEFRNGLATIHGYARLMDLRRCRPRNVRTSKAFGKRRRCSAKSSRGFSALRVPIRSRWHRWISGQSSSAPLKMPPRRS